MNLRKDGPTTGKAPAEHPQTDRRYRSRSRLIGAVLLLGAGVFTWLSAGTGFLPAFQGTPGKVVVQDCRTTGAGKSRTVTCDGRFLPAAGARPQAGPHPVHDFKPKHGGQDGSELNAVDSGGTVSEGTPFSLAMKGTAFGAIAVMLLTGGLFGVIVGAFPDRRPASQEILRTVPRGVKTTAARTVIGCLAVCVAAMIAG